MACDHHTTITTQDGTRICRHCFASVPTSFRAPNSFVLAPATALNVTGISIAAGFVTALGGFYVGLGFGGVVGAFDLFGRLIARTAGF